MSEPDDTRARVLGRTALFGGLDAAVLARLAAMARPLMLATGAHVFRKGDDSRSLYVIERGRVKIAATSADGREVALNLLGADEVFGEVALADGGPRTADAVACEPVRLLAFDRAELTPFLESEPKVMLRMLAALARRVRWVSGALEDSVFLPLPTRMAKRLMFLNAHFGVSSAAGRRLTVSLPQRELASHMNVTRETVNRLIQDWREEGLIAVDRGVFVLKDIPRLAELAGRE
jgi:CRP/FNR family cyclic AMP-dependent transcriptional regulator